MYIGVTTTGFEYSIDEKNVDNMELVDAIAEVMDGDSIAVSKICKMILGTDQRKRLYDHIRLDDGRVPIEAATKEIIEIFNGAKAGKK